MCAYQGVRYVSFPENFAYVLNEWSHNRYLFSQKTQSQIFGTVVTITKQNIHKSSKTLTEESMTRLSHLCIHHLFQMCLTHLL